jgi:hypothetical protein
MITLSIISSALPHTNVQFSMPFAAAFSCKRRCLRATDRSDRQRSRHGLRRRPTADGRNGTFAPV